MPPLAAAQAMEARMRALLAERPHEPLPPVHAWARTYRTATRVVLRILHKLRDEGLVEVRRGRKAAAPAPHPADPPRGRTPVALTYEAIRESVEEGRYPPGTRLPKTGYFAVEHRVSHNTVRRALRLLERDHLVHREGRHAVAGPSVRSAAGRAPGQGPVILMLQADEQWWENTLASDWIAPFSHGFMREVNLAGTQVVPVFYDQPRSGFLVHGEEAIRDFVGRLDYRYRGTLIMGQSWDFLTRHNRTIPDIARWFAGLERPVVWFDFIDETAEPRPTFDPAGYAAFLRDRRARRLFTRCHFNHDGALRLALETLYGFGHRRIGIPWFAGDDRRLAEARVNGLRALAAEWPGLSLVVQEAPGNPFAAEGPAGTAPAATPARWLRRLPAEGRAFLDKSDDSGPDHARLPALNAVMLPLLLERGVTAIIAMNDARARHYYLWLRTMGYRVPEDLSLLSFDAVPRLLYPWQISSVDFGFGHLSSCAYHLIMEDVPVERRNSDLPARCRLNHMGSVGPARSK